VAHRDLIVEIEQIDRAGCAHAVDEVGTVVQGVQVAAVDPDGERPDQNLATAALG
jgi:hypothetical protein